MVLQISILMQAMHQIEQLFLKVVHAISPSNRSFGVGFAQPCKVLGDRKNLWNEGPPGLQRLCQPFLWVSRDKRRIIGRYPNLGTFVSLYSNPEYVHAFRHRTAAVARQAVVVMEQ